ncbi:MAG: stage 0 sporulation family protein [Clostridiales bacterium]
MIEVVGVRFKSSGKIYYFDPIGLTIPAGTDVVVETARGLEYGKAVLGNRQVELKKVVQPLRKVIRLATVEDREKMLAAQEKEEQARALCLEKIVQRQLPMKLVGVEYSFDGSKVLFYFTAEGRVDFRELVKDLAAIFKTRIELRQIGVRDEAKMLGGLGSCGRELCCASFLSDFEPVSIRMAKEQNLSLNPSKISGICGRLMCCLKYESYGYECNKKCRCPKNQEKQKDPSEIELAEELLKEGYLTEADLADYPELEEIIVQVKEKDEEQDK